MRPASVLIGITSLLVVLAPTVTPGQVPAKLEFEVASVRMTEGGSSAPANLLAEFNFGPMNEMADAVNAARKAAGISEPRDPKRIVLPYVPLATVGNSPSAP